MEAVGQTELDGHNHIHLNVGGQWYSVPKCVVGRYRESKLHQAVFRFLLGVIEDSKKLGDVPELTAEVARLVHRLWNAHLSPSTFVDCLSQLAPFKSHTCMHLTPWIKVRTLR
ncbi:uncharacterized protein LOC118418432 isoform X2 [Branchiostoma floridae]|uniref:Uncharacterized protein LOC118418432 isoform X2 n=1 Tax=Branchiostoma floridae TaxID=7739 RepID=A0A9J7MVB2_BRAFL|nr:uncharacterized protein LOC118418432 isoform X2 [Branchiostoma floridae]